jgi:hypothetical protein
MRKASLIDRNAQRGLLAYAVAAGLPSDVEPYVVTALPSAISIRIGRRRHGGKRYGSNDGAAFNAKPRVLLQELC